jgi:hypothetical protein
LQSVLHALLCLLPAVLLAIPLLARRYPGERALLALRRVEPPRWPRPRSCKPPRRGVALAAVRAGRLMGRSLAVRPPPVSIAAS